MPGEILKTTDKPRYSGTVGWSVRIEYEGASPNTTTPLGCERGLGLLTAAASCCVGVVHREIDKVISGSIP